MDTKTTMVRDLMNTDTEFIDKNTSVISTAKLMVDKGLSSFIVVPDIEYDTFGIITRKDVVEALINDGAGGASLLVEDIMTKPTITVNPELSIYNCHQMMLMVGVRRMPVVEGSKLVGIISNSDILKHLVG